jgi:hypothetical protein
LELLELKATQVHRVSRVKKAIKVIAEKEDSQALLVKLVLLA